MLQRTQTLSWKLASDVNHHFQRKGSTGVKTGEGSGFRTES